MALDYYLVFLEYFDNSSGIIKRPNTDAQ